MIEGGFFGDIGTTANSEYDLVLIPREKGINNTLAFTKDCENDPDIGYVML